MYSPSCFQQKPDSNWTARQVSNKQTKSKYSMKIISLLLGLPNLSSESLGWTSLVNNRYLFLMNPKHYFMPSWWEEYIEMVQI